MAKEDHVIVFSESQPVREIWAFLLVGGIALVAWVAFGAQLASGRGINGKLLAYFVPLGVLLPALILSLDLITEVRSDGIYAKLFPLHLSYRRFAFSDIASMNIRTYDPIAEYGGWGLRWWWKSGWAYNMSGDKGLQLVMKDGKRILIGTQQPEALWRAIEGVAPPALRH